MLFPCPLGFISSGYDLAPFTPVPRPTCNRDGETTKLAKPAEQPKSIDRSPWSTRRNSTPFPKPGSAKLRSSAGAGKRKKPWYLEVTTFYGSSLSRTTINLETATAPRRPFRLIFPVRHSLGDGGCEYYLSESDARRREGYLKTTAGRKGLKLILRETLTSLVWD